MKLKLKLIIAVVLLLAGILAFTSVTSNVVSTENTYNSFLETARLKAEKGIPYVAVQNYSKAFAIKNEDESIYKEYMEQCKLLGEDFYMNALENYVPSFPMSAEAYELMCTYYFDQGSYKKVIALALEAREKGIATEAVKNMYYESYYNYKYIAVGFDEVGPFNGDVAVVKSADLYGYIYDDGTYMIDTVFSEASIYTSGAAAVCKENEWYMTNTLGYKIAVPEGELDYLSFLSNGKMLVGKDGKYDYTDSSIVVPETLRFDDATNYRSGVAAVKSNGKWALINDQNEFITDFIFIDIILDDYKTCVGNNVIFAKESDKYYMYGLDGSRISDVGFDNAYAFISTQPAAVCVDGKWGFIDNTGNFVIEPQYENAKSFCCGLAPVSANGFWGYIDSGNVVRLDNTFEDCTTFSPNGVTAIFENNVWNYIKLLPYTY